MKYAIHSVSPTPQPFLFTLPFPTAAPICFLGGPVLIDMFVCMVLAWTIIFDTFWQCGIESICLAKSCDPNTRKTKAKIPQTRAKTIKRAQILISGHLGQFESCLKEHEFNRSHAHSVCLNLPIKQQGLQPRTEPLLWIDGFLMGQSRWPQPVFPKIALFSFYDSKSLRFFNETPH